MSSLGKKLGREGEKITLVSSRALEASLCLFFFLLLLLFLGDSTA